MGENKCAYCWATTLIVIGATPILLSAVLTSVYANHFEDESRLAKSGAQWMIYIIVIGGFILCGTGAISTECLIGCGLCLSITISIMGVICTILVSVSVSKNANTSTALGIGVSTAVFTFLLICGFWILLAGVGAALSSKSEKRGSYHHSPSVSRNTTDTSLNLTEEQKKQLQQYLENLTSEERNQLLEKLEKMTDTEKMVLVVTIVAAK